MNEEPKRVQRSDGTVVATVEERGGLLRSCCVVEGEDEDIRRCRLGSENMLRVTFSFGEEILESELPLCAMHGDAALNVLYQGVQFVNLVDTNPDGRASWGILVGGTNQPEAEDLN